MKKIILVFALGLFSFNIYAQDWVWARSAGATIGYGDGPNGIATDVNGNVYASGFFTGPQISFGNFTLINADSSGQSMVVYLVKYDALGNVLWAKGADKNSNGDEFGIAVDIKGNAYICGEFNSSQITFDSITLLNTGKNLSNIFIAKFSPSGKLLWAKSNGGTGGGEGYGIGYDGNDYIYVTGVLSGPIVTFDTISFTPNSYNNYAFILKYDTSGNSIWLKTSESPKVAEGDGVAIDNEGNVIVVGEYETSITIGTHYFLNADPSGQTYDIFIAKYNSSGDLLWVKSAGGITDDYPGAGGSVVIDREGNIYITGSFDSPSIMFGNTTLTNSDSSGLSGEIYVVKYDSSGNVIWAKNSNGGNAGGNSIALNSNGNLFITGNYSNSMSLEGYLLNIGPPINPAIFIIQCDTGGKVLWAYGSGGSNNGYGFGSGIAIDSSGNIYIDGTFYTPYLTFGSYTLQDTSASSGAFFLVKLDLATGINEVNNSNSILIYPNPTANTFHLITNSLHEAKLNIYNTLGEVVEQTVITNPNSEIDLSNLPAGIYFVQVQDGASVYNGKVVKGPQN